MAKNTEKPPVAGLPKSRELEPREGAARQLLATRARLRVHALRQALHKGHPARRSPVGGV